MPIEYALYKSKNPSDAFENIHWKIADTERTRIEETELLRGQMESVKNLVKSFEVEFWKTSTEIENLRILNTSLKQELA